MGPQDETYNQFVEAIIDFLKAKRDEAILRGHMPNIDMLISELEQSKNERS